MSNHTEQVHDTEARTRPEAIVFIHRFKPNSIMEDTKHTPGEWYTMDARSLLGLPYIITDGKVTIAQSYEGYTAEETEANAKLIAAAPDLLKALQELSYELTGEQECEEELEKGLGWQLALKVQSAKTAIAKATLTPEPAKTTEL